VETKSLDGETNLKHKESNKDLVAMCTNDQEAIAFTGDIKCEQPNDKIYKFDGNITVMNTRG
jgi:magnesium-transporting ATPase (P-type)